MKILVICEVLVIVIIFLIRYFYKLYQRHRDKHKVKAVLNYLQYKTGSVEVEKLQKILGVENETKNKN